jgi:serine/threonine-protein phosphatase 2A regulatory subunit B
MKMIVFLINLNVVGHHVMSKCNEISQNKFFLFFSSHLLTGSYHNLFKITSRLTQKDAIFESSREQAIRPRQLLKSKKVLQSARRNRRDEINPDSLEFSKKILHCAYHPTDDIIAIATAHNLFTYIAKDSSSSSSS